MNKVILVGNVSRAPKTYLTHHGKEFTTFFVETTDSWRDEAGEWHSATDRHRISVFRESTVRWVKDVLKYGDPIFLWKESLPINIGRISSANQGSPHTL